MKNLTIKSRIKNFFLNLSNKTQKVWLFKKIKDFLSSFNKVKNSTKDSTQEPGPAKSQPTRPELAKLMITIEEFPNKDIIAYHISDPITKMCLHFEKEEDLKYGGLMSLNHEKEVVPQDTQYLAGAILQVEGIIEISFRKYNIRFTKSPVFDWEEIEKDIQRILKELVAKERTIFIKERIRSGVDHRGFATHEKIS